MLVLIETRLAELLNEAQEVPWFLRSIVKEPSAEDLRPGDILRMCIRYQEAPAEEDRSMSLTELRLAPGVTEALLNEALWLLTFPGDRRITYPTPGRVALGPDWRGWCEGPTAAGS